MERGEAARREERRRLLQSGAAAELTAMRDKERLGRQYGDWSCSQMKFFAAKISVGAAWEGAEGEAKKTI